MRFLQGDVFSVDLAPKSFALAYADPPYANCRFQYARRNKSRQWGKHARADFMRELIARMEWLRAPGGVCGISMTSTEALRLGYLFPSDARQLGWFKPFAVMRPGVWPAYAWEPMVAWGDFPGRVEQKASQTPHDWLNCSPRVPKKTYHETPKPEAFAEWVINVTMGPRRGPVLELFAGTCPVARMAEHYGCESTAVDFDDYREQTLFSAEAG